MIDRITYISKKIEHLINISKCSQDKDKRFCPICERKIKMDEFDSHVSVCYKFAKEPSLVKLPYRVAINEEQAATLSTEELEYLSQPKMTFKNYKNMLERPYVVYADIEAILIKCTDDMNKEDANTRKYQHIKQLLHASMLYAHMITHKIINGHMLVKTVLLK